MEKNASPIDRMYTDIEWALSEGLAAGQLIPMVERLMKEAAPRSLHQLYAKRQLAELIVRKAPFRAARLAQDVLDVHPEDDRAHAVQGLACLLMGHYKKAERSYRTALAMMPHCPWYAHNLGHLLDVALGRSGEAVHWLAMARRALPHEPEIASSLAHALLRAGDPEQAMQLAVEATGGSHKRAQELISTWLEE